jgi:hypothetical protein
LLESRGLAVNLEVSALGLEIETFETLFAIGWPFLVAVSLREVGSLRVASQLALATSSLVGG